MNILYISRNLFPYGAAYASRVTHFAKMLHDMGHKVHIITDYTIDAEEDERVELGFCSYQALYRGGSIRNTLNIEKKRLATVRQYLEREKTDYIITNSFPNDYVKMKRLMDEKGVPYIIEVCEWFDPTAYKLGRWDIRYFRNQKALKNRYLKEKKIIAISRYLQDYFTSHQVPCIRVPAILDLEEHKYSAAPGNDKVRIMYAGNPGKTKELLGEIFQAIASLKREDERFGDKFCFDLYGVNEKQVLLNLEKDRGLLEYVRDCIQIQGKVSQESINEVYRQHDFSIFMRPHRRSSDAGFPTKLAESLAAGTPVIANATGDIDCYIQSGSNGFVVENDREILKKLLRELVSMKEKTYQDMRQKARETAENSFDYKIYKREMDEFLQ